MKSLKDYILEGVLVGQTDTLSKSIEDIFPVPTRKDIKRVAGGSEVIWVCPQYKQYINVINDMNPEGQADSNFDSSRFDAIKIFIRGLGAKMTIVQLVDSTNPNKNYLTLKGVGSYYINQSAEKDAVITFLNKLNSNSENFKVIFEIFNDSCKYYKSQRTQHSKYGGSWDGLNCKSIEEVNDILK